MAEMSRDYVIRKRGYFYRPEAQGYCSDVRDAGRWSYEDAIAYQKGVDGVTVHHLREFPVPTPDQGTPERFHITWRDGAYYVSVPNYRGGEVVDAALFDEAVKLLDALLGLEKGSGQAALEFVERHGGRVGSSREGS
jgi:hypothetical protein